MTRPKIALAPDPVYAPSLGDATLRDFFGRGALEGIVQSRIIEGMTSGERVDLARQAWAMADAMLQTREER